ncbi:MAG: hypothetical protein EBR73_12745 [Rhodobacteraceae bacterium]|nr:hypothetical protein [Paracoccaceae bacterium]
MRWSAADLRGARLWWVVSVRLGGALRRFSTASLDIVAADEPGGAISVEGALAVPILRKQAPAYGAAPEARTAALTILPTDAPGAWLAQGHRLEGQPVEVALWREGDDWSQRRVQLRGTTTSAKWGAAGEPIDLDIEESVDQDRAVLPAPGMAVSATTWPDAATAAEGLAYPVVIGQPGIGGAQATPALYVESILAGGARDLLLVAGHPVQAASVTVYDDSGASESLAVEHVSDGAGQRVAVVDLAGATTIAVDPEGTYRCAWVSGAGWVGADGSALRGAGDVAAMMLAASTLPVDTGAALAARERLNQYLIDAVIDAPISPSAWLASAVLPVVPAAMVAGVSGWSLRPLPVAPQLGDAVATLRIGTGITRDGQAVAEGYDAIANALSLRYAPDAEAEPTAEVKLAAAIEGGAHATQAAARSLAMWGLRELSTESIAIHDPATALRVLRWWSVVRGQPQIRLRYLVGTEWAWVEPGDVLRVVDADLSLDCAVILDAVEWLEGGLLALEVIRWN